MFLGFVAVAQPENVLGCGLHVAEGAFLDLGSLPVLHCCLDPCVEVVLALGRKLVLDSMVGVPVDACDQIVIVWFAGKSVDALVLGFLEDDLLEFPPRLLQVKFITHRQWCLWAGPSQECACLPSPFS